MSWHLEHEAAFQASQAGFFWRQWLCYQPRRPRDPDLAGQTAIVTGASGGLGLEAGRQLLERGLGRLVMGVRSLPKAEAAAAVLRADFPAAEVVVWALDLERYGSVRAFVDRCGELDRIDAAVLNAGVENVTFVLSPETQHEQTLQTNYLSTALLALWLLPLLVAKRKRNETAKPPVLCIVTSDTAYWTDLAPGPVLAQLDDRAAFDSRTWYARTKLMEQLFVVRLAEAVAATDVTINMVTPGLCRGTDMNRGHPASVDPLFAVFKFFMARSLSAGASTYVDAVVHQGPESHGAFLGDWRIQP